ncbi:hypothetical protein STENM327S_01531 [Streptomyces tendae]
MDRASLDGHVTSAFADTLLVSGGDAEPLTALGEVTDASGYALAQNVDREFGAWANYMMAAVLGGFAAVAAVNTLAMTVLDRRRELHTLRLVGSTRRQVLRMLGWESLLVSAAGVALGTAIAMITLTPMMRGRPASSRTTPTPGRRLAPPRRPSPSPRPPSRPARHCATGAPDPPGRADPPGPPASDLTGREDRPATGPVSRAGPVRSRPRLPRGRPVVRLTGRGVRLPRGLARPRRAARP